MWRVFGLSVPILRRRTTLLKTGSAASAARAFGHPGLQDARRTRALHTQTLGRRNLERQEHAARRNETSHRALLRHRDSTAMTERLGPEAMRDLVSSFLEASLAEVHRYGGTRPAIYRRRLHGAVRRAP